MRSLLLGLALLVLADAASAQRHRSFAEKGDLALTAQIVGLGDLRLRPALGGVGIRYRLGDRSVLGTSVGFNVNTFDEDRGADGDAESVSNGGSVTVWTEQHMAGRRRTISPFLAFGVEADYRRNAALRSTVRQVCDGADCVPVEATVETDTDQYSVGAGVGVGAEVRLVRGITLGAAYTVGGAYTWTDNDQSTVVDGEVTTRSFSGDGIRAGTNVSAFYLSVYL